MERMSRRKSKTSHVFALIGFLVLGSFLYIHVTHDLFFPYDADSSSPPMSFTRQTIPNMVLRESTTNSPPSRFPLQSSKAVLLPDWEALVIADANVDTKNLSCRFQNGAISPARFGGMLPSSRKAAFVCSLPNSVRRLRPFYAPRLVQSGMMVPSAASPEMARWNRLTYESLSTPCDVIVFAKGINRQSVDRPVSELRCVFVADGGASVSETVVMSSAQEVFRCAHPNISTAADVAVSIRVVGEEVAVPTVTTYKPLSDTEDAKDKVERKLLCVSTMVYNVTKFLSEWLKYHAAVGVEKFVLYDNGSEDGLELAVARLRDTGGYDVEVVYWPWSKTQEAGFSHAAATYRDACAWMAFIDVDEFVFALAWSDSYAPNRTMLTSLLPVSNKAATPAVGQVLIRCLEFGPSGRHSHPKDGVTQGYMCRRRADNRHKSIVRLEAIHESLGNSIHHFVLDQKKWSTRWVRVRQAVVNHYKYQAWDEFRVKFRRRASSFVADWQDQANLSSKDRTPGLGFRPVEPDGWASRFCEVNDTRLSDVTRRWFGGPGPDDKLAWEG